MSAPFSEGGRSSSRQSLAQSLTQGIPATNAESKYPLPCRTMLVYSQLKFMFSLLDFTLRPARFATYIEGLGMPASVQATLIAVCQCFSLCVGVVMGKWSDDCKSSYGRRKPFIAIGMPLGLLCFVLFCTPTLTFFQKVPAMKAQCSEYVGNEAALVPCLTEAFNLTVDPMAELVDVIPEKGEAANVLFMSLFFALLYVGYYSSIWNAVSIPYDALGMELTDDSDRRVVMFAVRGLLQVVGYGIPNVIMLYLATLYAEDVPRQYAILAIAFAVAGLIGTVVILVGTTERPPVETKQEAEGQAAEPVPIIPSIRRVMSNPAYMTYLKMRAPFTIVALLPTNMALYYIKFVLQEENYISLNASVSVFGIIGIVVGIYPVITLARKYERSTVLWYVSILMVAVWVLLFLAEGSTVRDYIFLFYGQSILVGLSWAAFFMLPDGMLGDCIDYDELLSGQRNEAMYTVVETQLSLSIEILGGVLPLTLLQLLDYSNNGGCSCGCGVPCKDLGAEFARWICPGDVGFTVDGTIGSALLFGDPDRVAPCTQQSEMVQWGIKFFYVGFPAICGLLAMIPISQWKITNKMNIEIQSEVRKRAENPGYVCTDPITGLKVTPPEYTGMAYFKEHFSTSERRSVAGGTDVLDRLKSMVTTRMMSLVGVFVVIASVMLLFGEGAAGDAIRTMGILLLTLTAASVGWQVVRLQVLKEPPAGATASLNSGTEGVELAADS